MTHAVEKKVAGRELVTVAALKLTQCSLTYGFSACDAGLVATGASQGAGSFTIKLDASDTNPDDYYNGMLIKITSGAGAGQERVINDYDSTTKFAILFLVWATIPGAGDTYTINDINSPIACHNTRFTCQDTANFTATIEDYSLVTPIDTLPKSERLFPCVVGKPKFSSSKFAPGGGLGKRATVSIKVRDFTHHDRGIDPYAANRSYDTEQGTFFGKLLARNIHYIGRTLLIRTGYYTDTWNWDNFQDRTYVIERIDGPDKNNIYTIHGKDILKLADDDRIKIPAVSDGKLSADITDSDTTLSVGSGQGADYASSGTIAIGSEEMTYTRSTDTFTVVRAVNGTSAQGHSKDNTVQECRVWTAENVVNIVQGILKNDVGIDESKLPFDEGLDTPTGTPDEWDDEKSNWLSGHNFTRTISKPTGAKKLLNELCIQGQLNVWHDLLNDLVKLKANAPPLANASVVSLNDNAHFIAGSVSVKDEQEMRVSRVEVWYNKLNNAGDEDEENYGNVEVAQNATSEGADLFGSQRIKKVFANWMGEGNAGQALAMAGRVLGRYSNPPKSVDFMLDVKDDTLSIGDLAEITTHKLPSVTGASVARRMQILEDAEVEAGHSIKYSGLTSTYEGIYGFITLDSQVDRTSATDEEKLANAFIAPDTGFFANGDTAYKIV